MKTLLDRASEWCLDPTPAYWAVFCRIGFGLILLVTWTLNLEHYSTLFSPTGLGGAALHVPGAATYTVFTEVVGVLRRVESPALMQLLYGGLLVASLCFLLGFHTRKAGIAAALLHALFVARNEFAFWGWASMIHLFVIYTVCADPGQAFSFDARRRGNTHVPVSPAWPMRLLQLHVCLMYAVAGWPRLGNQAWLDGSLLHHALTYRRFARFEVDWMPYKGILEVLCLASVVLEPAASIALWFRRISIWVLIPLIGLHVGLEILTLVGWWNFMMLCGLTAFMPPSWLAAVARRLPGWAPSP